LRSAILFATVPGVVDLDASVGDVSCADRADVVVDLEHLDDRITALKLPPSLLYGQDHPFVRPDSNGQASSPYRLKSVLDLV
jgi:hypothetical protein